MKKTILLLAAIVTLLQVKAQVAKYDLNTYETPDYSRDFLITDVNNQPLGSSLTNSESRSSMNLDLPVLSLTYGKIAFTKNKVTNRSARADMKYFNSKNSSATGDESDMSFSNNLSAGYETVKYASHSNFFFSHGLNASSRFSSRKFAIEDSFQMTSGVRRDRMHSIGGQITVGFGRQWQVSPARRVLFVLEQLKNKGLLKRDIGLNEVEALAHDWDRLYRKRYFDTRLRRMYQIEKMDSILQVRNMIDPSASVYTVLMDNLFFANSQSRLVGTVYGLVVQPQWSSIGFSSVQETISQGLEDESTRESAFSRISLRPLLYFRSGKALSQRWQRNVSIQTVLKNGFSAGEIANSRYTNFSSKFAFSPPGYKAVSASTSVSYSYFPDNRSDWTIGVRPVDLSVGRNEQMRDYYVNSGVFIDYYRFVGPQTELWIGATLNYSMSNHSNFNKRLNSTFAINLKHQIF